MKIKKLAIPKGNGKIRKVVSVDTESKNKLRELLPELEKIVETLDTENLIFGFRYGKNPVLNAFQHIGFKYSLSMDLENFFDYVRPEHVQSIVSKKIIDYCFIDDRAPQGLPTSPAIANLALIQSDKAIFREINKISSDIVYTRYADDLTISFNDYRILPKISFLVNQIVSKNGFKINENKTKFQSLGNGRIIVTGIGVDRHGLHPTRKTLKKLRAAQHQGNILSKKGLFEWAECKLPKKIVS